MLIHVVVYAKIYLYKRSEQLHIGSQSNTAFQLTSLKSKIDSQSLFGIGINLVILLTFASITTTTTLLKTNDPEEFNKYPFYLYVYYIHLIVPGLIGSLFTVSIYNRNNALRKTVFNEMRNMRLWQTWLFHEEEKDLWIACNIILHLLALQKYSEK